MKPHPSRTIRAGSCHSRAVCLLVVLLLGGVARADLKWDTQRLEFHPALTDKEVTAQFPFTNEGTAPVSIDSVNSGCGCTTAVPNKLTYQPGEKGTIQATFHLGDRVGLQEKVIRVYLHGVKDPVMLTMATYIPQMMRLEPRYVFWRAGDAPDPRLIRLTTLADAKVMMVHATSTNPKFKVAVHPVHPGNLYFLVVTPTDTSARADTVFNIAAISGPGAPNGPPTLKTFQAFASITPR